MSSNSAQKVVELRIKQALHTYPNDLVIVTKVGGRRGADGSWLHARSRQEIGSWRLVDVTADDIEQYLRARLKKHAKVKTKEGFREL